MCYLKDLFRKGTFKYSIVEYDDVCTCHTLGYRAKCLRLHYMLSDLFWIKYPDVTTYLINQTPYMMLQMGILAKF